MTICRKLNFPIPISDQAKVVDLRYFKIYILLDQKIWEISKVYIIRLQRYMGILPFEFAAKTQFI